MSTLYHKIIKKSRKRPSPNHLQNTNFMLKYAIKKRTKKCDFMKRIPNLKLSDKEYYDLINQAITRGGEGIICPGSKPTTLFKIFIDYYGESKPLSENKERKIIELYQLSLEDLVKPIRTISYKGQLIGYEMSYDQLDIVLKDIILPRKELIAVLKKSRESLLRLKEHDITYGDVTEDNILYNPKSKTVKFCDIDNIRLGNLPVDAKGFSLQKYYSLTGTMDEKADAFMHNILTIKALSYDYSTYDTEILLDLKRGNYPPNFKQSAKPIFDSMNSPKSFNGEYIVQYIKR